MIYNDDFLMLGAREPTHWKSGLMGKLTPPLPFERRKTQIQRPFFTSGWTCECDFGKLLLSFIKNKWISKAEKVFSDVAARAELEEGAQRRSMSSNFALVLISITTINQRLQYFKLKTDRGRRLGMSWFVNSDFNKYISVWKKVFHYQY